MRLTKFEHSAMLLEQTGARLFIDPGNFTTPITEAVEVVAVVITHEHPDHWTPEQLRRIIAQSPEARILGPAGVAAAAAPEFEVEVVSPGDSVEVGPFTLRFFGGRHAVIHSSIPVIDNVGVLVNDGLFYPGDSFTVPEGVEVDTLAVPAGAPWLKIGEVMDYLAEVKPRRSFPAHEMTLSVNGKNIHYDRIRTVTEQGGGTFYPLEPAESLDF
ncbi:MBL fold metallo-hydrolase [Herbiconiux sp. SYSU D00978]|uniref:MBL fold metallo-hydrolase n=1 Tax=Herbiconiux sp. SYSU D00978 TaxID=2812562 RepID=UPI001A968E44|nr:MBL fold metallo-hydrolase [Herbiconiux sp. SYSU D00978]